VDIRGKARRLESKIVRALDSAAQSVIKSRTRDPLEIAHAIVDAVEQEVQPAGRGKHVFPFNRIRVSIAALSALAPDRYEAVFEGEPTLRERILERLRSAGCEVSELEVQRVYVPQPQADWKDPGFDLEFARLPPTVEVIARRAAPSNPIELTVMHGAAQQPAYSLTLTRIDLGRCVAVRDSRNRLIRTNHVAFTEGAGAPNQTVSRRHAHIAYDPESRDYRIHDDGSAHGTSVVRNGRTIAVPSGSRGIRLQTDDEIVLGEARLRVTVARGL
jgi:hypothetical protein